ncbi:hypothetical protein [Cognatishimia sp. F0-27]|uniref:hypothetical protein n=1 Tax=Cognatishimia sp. F0-27 TaxID=2816855 RepID=UPI001D0C2C3D|nr:hypothetical protein [Cognatishimia sp. F0-27]MCC1493876.1 hypothetical protein [Cognatishimia sp. F0-27]
MLLSNNFVEAFDILDHLASHGLPTLPVVETVEEAVRVIEGRDDIHLIILGISHSAEGMPDLTERLVRAGHRLILIDASATMPEGRVIAMTRPFSTQDLDRCLTFLGLL